MKRFIFIVTAAVITSILFAAPSDSSNDSNVLEKQKDNLDKQIADFSTKINDVIKNYDLENVKDIKIVPYRTNYKKTDDAIEIIRHSFIRHDRTNEIIGMRTKSLKVYGGGSKFESRIWERNYDESHEEEVILTDPSPASEGSDDITLTYVQNGKKIVDERKLSDIKNVDAFPIANQIRRDFYVKHLSFFYYTLVTIAETYAKDSKDSDNYLKNFLESSTEY